MPLHRWIRMMVLSKPPNQDRFNACIFDLLNLRLSGYVTVPGSWDCYDTLGYLERRMKKSFIGTQAEDGSVFVIGRKTVCFMDEEVVVYYS